MIDECDKVLDNVEMRSDVQEVFKLTPHDKQVMMFSATLDKEVRPICKKFMTDVSTSAGRRSGRKLISFFSLFRSAAGRRERSGKRVFLSDYSGRRRRSADRLSPSRRRPEGSLFGGRTRREEGHAPATAAAAAAAAVLAVVAVAA